MLDNYTMASDWKVRERVVVVLTATAEGAIGSPEPLRQKELHCLVSVSGERPTKGPPKGKNRKVDISQVNGQRGIQHIFVN